MTAEEEMAEMAKQALWMQRMAHQYDGLRLETDQVLREALDDRTGLG